MTWRTIYNNLTAGNQPASDLDQSFTDAGLLGVIPCSATGTNAIVLTESGYTPPVSAYANYLLFSFTAAATSTGAVTVSAAGLPSLKLFIAGGGSQATTGSVVSGTLYIIAYVSTLDSGNGGFVIVSATAASGSGLTVLNNYRTGFTMSTAGASTTMTVGVGDAADSTNAVMMSLGSAMSKTTASWASGTGNGGLDTGVIATSTGYHFYVIAKAGAANVDIIFSLADPFNNLSHGSGPALPSGYIYWRWIGWGKTDGSSNWTGFTQTGNTFLWSVPARDVNAAVNPGTAAILEAVTVPSGINVMARGSLYWNSGSTNPYILITQPAQTDTTPSVAAFTGKIPGGTDGTITYSELTNTSAQYRFRASTSGASDQLTIITHGWEIPANANY